MKTEISAVINKYFLLKKAPSVLPTAVFIFAVFDRVIMGIEPALQPSHFAGLILSSGEDYSRVLAGLLFFITFRSTTFVWRNRTGIVFVRRSLKLELYYNLFKPLSTRIISKLLHNARLYSNVESSGTYE